MGDAKIRVARTALAALAAMAIGVGSGRAAKTAAPEPAKPAAAPSGPLTPREVFADPVIFSPQLSPSGRYLAFAKRVDQVDSIMVVDLDHAENAYAGITFRDTATAIDWVAWKSDTRFVVGLTYWKPTWADAKQKTLLAWKYARFMLAADRDGTNQAILFKSDKTTARRTGQVMQFLDILNGDPDHILAVTDTSDGVSSVWKADIHTGAAQIVERGDSETIGWDTDSTGAIVGRLQQSGRTAILQGRAPGETRWSEVARFKAKTLEKELADFDLLSPAEAPGTSYVLVSPKGDDKGQYRTLHIYDFKTHGLGPDLWPGVDADLTAIVTTNPSRRLLGVCWVADVEQCAFKDPKLQANIRGLSKYFHGEKSLDIVSWSDDQRWSVIHVTGPDDPGTYVLYDWKSHEVRELGRRWTALSADRVGRRVAWSFKAADGTQVPGYLTFPPKPAAGPLPLVVLPHGGPMARDTLDFDPWAQLVASHGYLVFQPNFRGSGGLGRQWLEAGWRKWGSLMQDDVFDGVKALIEQGKADPARVCVFGASYGGYAALMQGALHPEAYKCIVSWAGVTDLARIVRDVRDYDGPTSVAYKYELQQLGDPNTDRDALTAASPIHFAADYKLPVFLLHGKDDQIVRPDQSQEMEKALKRAGKPVKLMLVDGEGHPDWLLDDQDKAFTAVLAFLDEHIGAPASPSPAVAGSAKAAP